MSVRTRLTWILFFIVVFKSLHPLAYAADKNNIFTARQSVEAFCNAEFEGDEFEKRSKFIAFSTDRTISERKRDPDTVGRVIYWDVAPLHVVESFKIQEVNIANNSGTAMVSYKRLAQSVDNGVLSADFNANDVVLLKLVLNNGHWWILDPPVPKVSPDALIRFYRDKFEFMGEGWINNPDLSDKQKQYYYKMQNNLHLLEQLKRNK